MGAARHLLDAVFFGALSRVSMPDFKPTSGTLEMLRDISLQCSREKTRSLVLTTSCVAQ